MSATKARHMDTLSIADTTALSDMNDFEHFFGKPKSPINVNPGRNNSVQNFDLPDAYLGRNEYLGSIITEMVLTANTFLTTVILPFKKADSLTLYWDKWTFDAHSTDVVPEEAPSRIVRSSIDHRTATLQRTGLALQLEHGFMKTERGKKNYLYNIRQIAHAIQESANYDVLVALLTADDVNYVHQRVYGNYNRLSIQEKLEDEKANWAIVQKDPMGFHKLDAKIVETQARYHGKSNTWIVPPAIQALTKFAPINVEAQSSGRTFDSEQTPIGMLHNTPIYVMRQYETSERGALQDLSIRARQIGEYNVLTDRSIDDFSNTDAYSSRERTIEVYDEARDIWAPISLEDCVNHMEAVFAGDGTILSLDAPDHPVPHYEDDVKHDLFMMPDETRTDGRAIPVEFWGQLRRKTMTPSMVLSVARSVIKAMRMAGTDIDKIEALVKAASAESLNRLSVESIVDLFKNVKPMPYVQDKQRFVRMPVPAGNVIYRVPAPGRDQEQVGREMLVASTEFKTLVSAMSKLLPGSLFLDGKWSSPLHRAYDYETAFENLFGRDGLAVWLRKDTKEGSELKTRNTLKRVIETLFLQLREHFGKVQPLEEGEKMVGTFVGALEDPRSQKELKSQTQFVYVVQNYLLTMSSAAEVKKNIEGILGMIQKAGPEPSKAFTGPAQSDATWKALRTIKGLEVFVDRALNILAQVQEGASTVPTAAAPTLDTGESDWVITDLILSPSQVAVLISDILSQEGEEGSDIGAVTVSNPLRLNEPILSTDELRRLMEDWQERLSSFASATNDPKTLPLFKLMSKMSASGGNVNKRVAVAQARDDRRTRRRFVYSSDAMDLDEPEQEHEYARRSKDSATGETTTKFNFDLGTVPRLAGKRFFKQYEALVNSTQDSLLLLVAKVFLAMPLTRGSIKHMISNNIRVPLGVLLQRPHMRYNMHLGIKVQAGDELGNMYMGHHDFIVEDSAQYKMHYGHMTLYTKAVVREEKNVVVAYDLVCAGNLGGSGTEWIQRAHYAPSAQRYGKGDIVAAFVALTEIPRLPEVLDASGHFSYFSDASNVDRDEDRKPHYSTAARMNAAFGFRVIESSTRSSTIVDRSHHIFSDNELRVAPTHNTVMWQGHQNDYNPVTRRHDIVTKGKGHFEDFVGPGSRGARRGELKEWTRA